MNTSKRKRVLTQNELEYLANHLSEISDISDLDEDNCDDSDDELNAESLDILDLGHADSNDFPDEPLDIENMPIVVLEKENIDIEVLEYEGDEGNDKTASKAGSYETRKRKALTENAANITKKKKGEKNKNLDEVKALREKFRNIMWEDRSLEIDPLQISFQGDVSLPMGLYELHTPYDFFSHFFDKALIECIIEQSNLFSTQMFSTKPVNLSALDMQKYIGICILMSVTHLPNIRSYWSRHLGIEIIKKTMSIKDFEKIRQNLHFNDNSKLLPKEHEDHDRLHKIRPIIDHLITKFQTVPYEPCLSIDEQMCSTKARNYLRQYMPAKPHKWGYKLFVLSGVSGYTYNFEIYTGQENDDNKRLATEENLGASSNVVVRLLRNVPRNNNYRVYFDNYYTSIPLLYQLSKSGILSLGTVRKNRIPNCPAPTDKELSKADRGKIYEYVCQIDDETPISYVTWKDNKIVSLVSSFTGVHPLTKIKRYDKTKRQYIEVDCPNLVTEYNRHMGGVDLLDSLIGRYRIKIKSKKWYIRIFYHLIDVTVVNSWLLYKKMCKERGEQAMGLADFRVNLGETLCLLGNQGSSSRGRKSDVERKLQEKKHRSSAAFVPPKEVRQDKVAHWPTWLEKRQRCKFPGCKGYTFVMCEKCSAALCFNKDKNCFKQFHVN